MMKRALLLVGILLCSGAAIAKETPAGGGGGSICTAGPGVIQTGIGTALDPYVFHIDTGVIGASKGGGIVACSTATGGVKNLIATAADNDGGTGVTWSENTTDEIGASAQSDTDGAANTAAIVAQNNTRSRAATICENLIEGDYDDWYLPAKDELNCLYGNRAAIGNFDTGNSGIYWSSTELNANRAYYLQFISGQEKTPWKYYAQVKVRCVRVINPAS